MAATAPHPAAAGVLQRYADALDARDWPGLASVLAPGFTARLVHTGESFDAEGYVAFNGDYPGAWRFRLDDVVADDTRVAGRAVVHDDTTTFHVALFATVEGDLLSDLVEVWADTSSAPRAPSPGGPPAPRMPT